MYECLWLLLAAFHQRKFQDSKLRTKLNRIPPEIKYVVLSTESSKEDIWVSIRDPVFY